MEKNERVEEERTKGGDGGKREIKKRSKEIFYIILVRLPGGDVLKFRF